MPRRKQYKIPAREMEVFDAIVAELQQKQGLADYDMNTLEISVKKKITPRIRDIDKAIDNLKRYISVNREFIQIVNGETIVSKKDIAKMLKISRPTLDKWIKDGFITPVQSTVLPNTEVFPPDLILEQLQNQKNKK
jgi:transcriptional regulator with PAS, ATPase and Fis domain